MGRFHHSTAVIRMDYSVVTATLNSSATIAQTISSVLRQRPAPVEYVFIDGGSSDSTMELIKSSDFASSGTKPILERQIGKQGIYPAVNQGIRACKSDIIFVLHSDDWLEPDAAAIVLAKFAANPDCEAVLASAYFHQASGKRLLRRQRPFLLFPLLMPVIHPAAFLRRSLYERVGFYDENYSVSADYDFFYRSFKAGVKFSRIERPLVNVMLGGYANTHRAAARKETLEIGLKYSGSRLLPTAAYLARLLSGR